MTDRDDILARMAELSRAAQALDDPALLAQMRALLAAPAAPRGAEAAEAWQGMVGGCPALAEIRQRVEKFAAVPAPVLIFGESGTGKDLIAHALHDLGPRAGEPFVSENCAAIPETLLESVLFGHVKGAFTGAVRDHAGHFVAADGGTLFLDEIGDMPLSMQVKLLRALQENEVRAVGGSDVTSVDVRVVAATNQALEEKVAAGAFREDLYYRLNVLTVTLPPLRERGDDVVTLARHFLASAAATAGRQLELGEDAEQAIAAARWPGNVRQLQNEMQRLATLADGPVITASELSDSL